jgi:spermidine synthase
MKLSIYKFDSKSLLVTAFTTGTILMALEMTGSRILAPYFGNTIYVWTNLIGIILLSLSVGYYIGGKLADRYNSYKLLYMIIFSASVYILLSLFFYKPLLSNLSSLGQLYGSILSTISLFAVPMVLLSMVPPFIIKFMSKVTNVGTSVGLVNSISTIGNIFGVFFSTFVTIPHLGTKLTLHFCFITLLLISVIFLSLINWRFIFLSLSILLLLLTPSYSIGHSIIYQDESLYSQITIKNESNKLTLYLDDEAQSVYNMETYFTGYYFEHFLTLPLINPTDDLLILGLGAGTSVDQFEFYYPEMNIDAVEIDKKVVDTSSKYFNLKETDKVKIYIDDARPFLSDLNKKYGIVEIDIFARSPYIPFYVATKEFFTLVSNSLTDTGVGGMNILAPGEDKELLKTMEQTMLDVFPTVIEIYVNGYNYVVMFSKEDLSLAELKSRLNSENKDIQMLIDSLKLKKIEKDDSIQILTDDKAPIELLTLHTRTSITE